MKKMEKEILIFSLVFFILLNIFNVWNVWAQIATTKNNVNYSKIHDNEQNLIYKRAWHIRGKTVDTKLPGVEVFRLAWSTEIDLSYWLQALPEQDRKGDKYVVIPWNGLVIPVNTVKEWTKEYEKFNDWGDEDFANYLVSWAVELPLEYADFWEVGKKVIMWHSSYFYNKSRYRTHFQKIISLNKSDEIWIYKKDVNNEFKRFVYKVVESKNVKDDDISILYPSDKDELVLFTCTPVWGIKWRWIVKAETVWN